MFSFFSRKSINHSVTVEDKNWIEINLVWMLENFGIDHLVNSPFILPTYQSFPFKNLHNESEFQELFIKICSIWGIDPNQTIVKFFDDTKEKEWSTWVYTENQKSVAGLFNQIYTTDEKRFKVQLAKSNLENPELTINVLAHELGHVKLIGSNLVHPSDPDMEALTDLTTIYFGFGIFLANTSITNNNNWLTKTGYLQSQIISYTNALLCYITEKDYSVYTPYLNYNTKELFTKDFEYLTNTNDTILNKVKVQECLDKFTNNKIITESFEKRDFEKVIEATKKLIELNPKEYGLYNTLGYGLLQQKKYKEAIIEFTKAIEIEPYWDYPYNNRGYCKLQLNELDSAFPDLHSSFEMNPTNSFSWRNLGVYYYFTEEFEKALHYFEEAEKIDPSTELINFYLSKVHTKLNNISKAEFYLDNSIKKNEYNDSIIS
jgi:tetratricopeptide (TPR) repeat protein